MNGALWVSGSGKAGRHTTHAARQPATRARSQPASQACMRAGGWKAGGGRRTGGQSKKVIRSHVVVQNLQVDLGPRFVSASPIGPILRYYPGGGGGCTCSSDCRLPGAILNANVLPD
eukprot:SAG11_NODE_10061_length_860_cov_0.621551_2_plen_116_part_01